MPQPHKDPHSEELEWGTPGNSLYTIKHLKTCAFRGCRTWFRLGLSSNSWIKLSRFQDGEAAQKWRLAWHAIVGWGEWYSLVILPQSFLAVGQKFGS